MKCGRCKYWDNRNIDEYQGKYISNCLWVRPKEIKLAVLVERKGREFPIQADYVGYKTDAEAEEIVLVNLVESDGKDEVVVK